MKREKQLLLDEIQSQIDSAPSFFIASYSKLTANRANKFRKELRKVGGNFEIVRKRMFLKAAERCGLQFNLDTLTGHIGVVIGSQDAIETSKAVLRFSDENEKVFQLLAAKVEGQLLAQADVVRLAQLPSKDQMRAELLGLFEAPMAQTLATMEALISSVVYCLDNKSKDQ